MPHQALEKRKRAMNECKVTELRTFVPSRDYDLSTRFYEDLVVRYEGVRAAKPRVYPWGLREINLIDPAGVLWHIAEERD